MTTHPSARTPGVLRLARLLVALVLVISRRRREGGGADDSLPVKPNTHWMRPSDRCPAQPMVIKLTVTRVEPTTWGVNIRFYCTEGLMAGRNYTVPIENFLALYVPNPCP
jgi:hypothetical protein